VGDVERPLSAELKLLKRGASPDDVLDIKENKLN
jgi:hypothetical protein